jgi:UDP-N-acetylmuramoylalanine--D-glutamate ligase
VYGPGTVKVYNADDERTASLAAAAPGPGALVAFRLGPPGRGELGVAGGWLVDRAFAGRGGVRLAEVSALGTASPDGRRRPPAPHNVADALAAAALARAFGVAHGAIAAGLAGFRPEPHRIALVARRGGVDYVDDSKATNPHAAATSVAAFGSVVWVAGGLFRAADGDLDELARSVAPRLRGAVLFGTDRGKFAAALARHARQIPVAEVAAADTGVMRAVVSEAARIAQPGDTVLLAPAAQSYDLFSGYPARGEAFAAAVRELPDAP